MNFFSGKVVAITGAAGTIGTALIKKLVEGADTPIKILALDNNETELFFRELEYKDHPKVCFFLCDIRNYDDIALHLDKVNFVFHCAALKHVSLCEKSPEQAILTNINGTRNVIKAAKDKGVERLIFTSSDKAVNPTNVMGTTKLMGERLITAANSQGLESRFSSTRFGNVLGSRGSVTQIFKNQIEMGLPVTLTELNMTRFIMSIEEAATLVIDSIKSMKGGEVFITKMATVKIKDLAEAMYEYLEVPSDLPAANKQIVVIGSKPGEKLYEELMTDEETARSLELDKFFAVLPAYKGFYNDIDYDYGENSKPVTHVYNSQHEVELQINEIKSLLMKADLSQKNNFEPKDRLWPGDKN